jgi:hypothetical protein
MNYIERVSYCEHNIFKSPIICGGNGMKYRQTLTTNRTMRTNPTMEVSAQQTPKVTVPSISEIQSAEHGRKKLTSIDIPTVRVWNFHLG